MEVRCFSLSFQSPKNPYNLAFIDLSFNLGYFCFPTNLTDSRIKSCITASTSYHLLCPCIFGCFVLLFKYLEELYIVRYQTGSNFLLLLVLFICCCTRKLKRLKQTVLELEQGLVGATSCCFMCHKLSPLK